MKLHSMNVKPLMWAIPCLSSRDDLTMKLHFMCATNGGEVPVSLSDPKNLPLEEEKGWRKIVKKIAKKLPNTNKS